jgi:hypothetical protein
MSKIFHLNLRRQWFDAIQSRQKRIEYRDITSYWQNRILVTSTGIDSYFKIAGEWVLADTVTICFSNGYSKDRDQMMVECLGIQKEKGWPPYGGDPDKEYYAIKLGRILSNGNTESKECKYRQA